jgi:4-azaleucine resistance transporter AzlC
MDADGTDGSRPPETADAPDDDHSRRRRYLGGVRVGLGLGFPTLLLAVTFGAMARDLGWGVLAPVVASAVVFSGSAQFALATSLGGGGGLPTAVASAALINARFAPMGLAVAPSLRGNRFRRAIEGQTVVDGSFVAAHMGGGRFDRERMMGATGVQYVAWVLGTLLGALLAPPPDLSEALGLDLVFPAFFLLLLLDEIRESRQARLAAGLGGAIAAGLVLAVPTGLALLGSSLGALVGLHRRRRDDLPLGSDSTDPADRATEAGAP